MSVRMEQRAGKGEASSQASPTITAQMINERPISYVQVLLGVVALEAESGNGPAVELAAVSLVVHTRSNADCVCVLRASGWR